MLDPSVGCKDTYLRKYSSSRRRFSMKAGVNLPIMMTADIVSVKEKVREFYIVTNTYRQLFLVAALVYCS